MKKKALKAKLKYHKKQVKNFKKKLKKFKQNENVIGFKQRHKLK